MGYNDLPLVAVDDILSASMWNSGPVNDFDYFKGRQAGQETVEIEVELQVPALAFTEAEARLRHHLATNGHFLLEPHTTNTAFAASQYVRLQFGRHDDTASFQRFAHVKSIRTGASQGHLAFSPYSATVGEAAAELFWMLNTGTFRFDVPDGTPAISVPNSTTVCPGLNAAKLQGVEWRKPLRDTFSDVEILTTDTVAASIDLTGHPAGWYEFELHLTPVGDAVNPTDDYLSTITAWIQPPSGPIADSFDGAWRINSTTISDGKPMITLYSDALYHFDGATDPVVEALVIKADPQDPDGHTTCRGVFKARFAAHYDAA